MRKNTIKVLDAFLNGKSIKPCPAIWTDGNRVYSYNTIIARKSDSTILVTSERFSKTTTVHTNGLVFGLTSAGKNINFFSQRGVEAA